MVPLSVLDLAPIVEGSDVTQALANSRDLAVNAERLGYHRFWLAEHHAMPGIASAATALTIMNAAAATTTIRVGAGGIMLPTTRRSSSPNNSARLKRFIRGASIWALAARRAVMR